VCASMIETILIARPSVVRSNWKSTAHTRHEFLKRFADVDTLICSTHFPAPSVGHVRRWRGGYRLDYLQPVARPRWTQSSPRGVD
jgi:hypothetical protein